MKTAIIFFSLIASVSPALADGRSDWSRYDWQSVDFGECLGDSGVAGCHAHHAKWDWKRNQWVDLFYSLTEQGVRVTQQLTNNDRRDDDFVCVTALFLDQLGHNLAVHHANVHIEPSSVDTVEVLLPLPSAERQKIAKVDVGSKQCREGASQDAEVWARVKAELSLS